MDHREAIRLQAAERYVLGELTKDLRDEYEEHYFDCAECAADVKATAAFVDNLKFDLGLKSKPP
jgi:anti-sigma factor RsiW